MSDQIHATLAEVETYYSIDDAADAHDALDWFDGLNVDEMRKMESQNQR